MVAKSKIENGTYSLCQERSAPGLVGLLPRLLASVRRAIERRLTSF
jgi:hypothetical protein